MVIAYCVRCKYSLRDIVFSPAKELNGLQNNVCSNGLFRGQLTYCSQVSVIIGLDFSARIRNWSVKLHSLNGVWD